MHIAKTLLLFFVVLITNINAQCLKFIQGRLYYISTQSIEKIIDIKDCSKLQGYDIIDSTNIFIAYSSENSAEISTRIFIYNRNNKTKNFIEEIGGTGESIFCYNERNDMVLFNWFDGIYVFKLHDSETKQIRESLMKVKICECNECFLPFWVDNKTFGYEALENENLVIKYFKME